MGCCRKAPKRTVLQQAVARRSTRSKASKTPPPVSHRGTLTATKPTSIICQHFETQGGDLLVNVTEQRKLQFRASGSTFDLEENIELYSCSGTVPTLVKVIRKKLDALSVAPTTQHVKLKDLLSLLIEMLKKEA